MSYEHIKKLTLLGLLGACLLGVSSIQRHMNQLKDTHELMIRARVENLTPTMAFCTGALGGFRGLIADVLFLRLTFLQEKEQYFELNELGHLILQLQPDMPEAVAHLAWNMSYNISVKFTAAEDRWRWVRRGIELCRDHGLKYNPSAPIIHHQLGWIYQHKIGEMMDDANLYYKSQLALQMIEVLGQKDIYDWDALANAPDNEDGLKRYLGRRLVGRLMLKNATADDDTILTALVALAKERQRLGGLSEFWETLFDEAQVTEPMNAVLQGFRDGGSSGVEQALEEQLVFLGEHSAFYRFLAHETSSHRKLEAAFRQSGDGRPSGGLPDTAKVKADELGIATFLDDYFRSRWLRDEYALDADKVPAILAKTGYLDFRLPYAHGIYWAQTGLAFSPSNKKLHRMVQQCLFASAKWGHLQYLSDGGMPIMRPNFESIDNYLAVYHAQPDHTPGDKAGAENFLKDSIALLYGWGENTMAKKWFRVLKTKRFAGYHSYKDKQFDEFAMDLLAGDVAGKSQDQVSSILFGMAKRYLEALAFEEDDKAAQLLRLLTRIRERYFEDIKKGSRHGKRVNVPPLKTLLVEAKFLLVFRLPNPEDVRKRFWNVGPDLRPIIEERQRRGKGNALDPNNKIKPKIQR